MALQLKTIVVAVGVTGAHRLALCRILVDPDSLQGSHAYAPDVTVVLWALLLSADAVLAVFTVKSQAG